MWSSAKQLTRVLGVLLFVYIVFVVIGLETLSGGLRRRCALVRCLPGARMLLPACASRPPSRPLPHDGAQHGNVSWLLEPEVHCNFDDNDLGGYRCSRLGPEFACVVRAHSGSAGLARA